MSFMSRSLHAPLNSSLISIPVLTLSRASMAKSTVYGRWGLRHLNFVFICHMATRLRMKLRIELFFAVIKSFWGVHVQVLAEIFAQRWAVSLSQRLVTEARGMQRQPWSNWTFLMNRNRLTTLEWSPTTMAVPFRFHVMVGLKLAAHQNRNKGQTWNKGQWRWVWIFYLRIKELFFFPRPYLTPIVSDIQYDLNEEKVKKVAKNMRWKCSLASCIADDAPPLSVGTVLCTHKRDFATVTLIPGRCFDRGGGGGYRIFQQSRGGAKLSIFPESLGPKGSDWCSFQVDEPPQAILEPRRVRWTLILGSTLRQVWIDAVVYNLLRLSTSEHTCVSILHQTQLFGTRCE